jgi:hypothetical protein
MPVIYLHTVYILWCLDNNNKQLSRNCQAGTDGG